MRNLDAGTKTEFLAGSLRPVIFVEAEFESGWLRVWSGLDDFPWDSKTWVGVGDLGDIAEIEETGDLRSTGLALSLSGIKSSIIGTVLGDLRQGKPCNVYFGALNEDGTLSGEPYGVFVGRLDTASIEDGPETARITINVENRMVDIERPRLRRFTNEDQKIDHPTDLGLENVSKTWRTLSFPIGADRTRPPT